MTAASSTDAASFAGGSLRAKVTLGVALPLIVILGALAGLHYRRSRSAMLEQLSVLSVNAGSIIESSVRHEMEEADVAGLETLFESLSTSEQFRVVYLLTSTGNIVFGSDGLPAGTRLDNRQPGCQPCHALAPEARPASIVVRAEDGEQVFRSMVPIRNGPRCSSCHGTEQELLGSVLIDIPTAPLETEIAASTVGDLLWLAATMAITVLVTNVVLSRLVIKRITGITRTVSGFGAGRRSLRVPAAGADEIGRLARDFNTMADNIETEEARNRVLSDEVQRRAAVQRQLLVRVINAQEEERRRVARDLHDELGQDLAGLAVGLQAVQQLWSEPPEPIGDRLRQIRSRIAGMTDRAYDLILTLRPSVLDDLGLVAALRAHAERVLADENVRFELEASEVEGRLPPEKETAVFRVLQEALSNVIRHAQAARVRIVLASRNGLFEADVSDDGKGFAPETIPADGSAVRGLGILGMKERIAMCGGSLEIFSAPGEGTRLLIHLPLGEVA